MNGTAWTEPGQGATVDELLGCLFRLTSLPQPRAEKPVPIARIDITRFFGSSGSTRTNLALTGAPLTADDVKRIAEAK